mgnify:CR=1 FL=1
MIAKKKLIVIGDVAKDLRIFVGKIPIKLGREVEIRRMYSCIGGAASVTSTIGALLDFETFIITKIGDDKVGQRILSVLKRNNVITDYAFQVKGRTARFITIYDNDFNRCIFYFRGKCRLTVDDINQRRELISNINIINICPSPLDVMRYIIRLARKENKMIVLNPSGTLFDLRAEDVRWFFENADLVVINEKEALRYTSQDSLRIV